MSRKALGMAYWRVILRPFCTFHNSHPLNGNVRAGVSVRSRAPDRREQ